MASNELWNREAEIIVLAALLRKPTEYYSINDVNLVADDFQDPDHKRIARAVFEIVDEKGLPEIPFIIESLNMAGHNTAKSQVSDLMSLPVSVPQAHESARVVKALSTSRRLQQIGVNIIEIAKQRRSNYEEAISDSEAMLQRLSASLPEPDRSPKPADILRRIRSAGPMESIPITFSPTLQQLTGGLHPGHLWVVGGFSSVGKTAWVCNMALDVLINRNKSVAIISAEMTQEQYVIRLMAIKSGVSQQHIRDRITIGLEEHEALLAAERAINKGNLLVYDTLYRMSQIRSEAKRLKQRDGLDVLIVDFIQNIHVTGDEVSDAREVALELQRLAKELECTVIAASQLSNAMAQQDFQEKGSGEYYAFKGSGAIKDAADLALMLRRKSHNRSPVLDVQMKKNRHGPMIDFKCAMDLLTGKIEEIGEEE